MKPPGALWARRSCRQFTRIPLILAMAALASGTAWAQAPGVTVTNAGELVLCEGAELLIPRAGALLIGEGTPETTGTLSTCATAPPPLITTAGTPGTDGYSFVVANGSTFDASNLEVYSTDPNGLVLEDGSVLTGTSASCGTGSLTGVAFDYIVPDPAGATFLQLLYGSGTVCITDSTFGLTMPDPGTPVSSIHAPSPSLTVIVNAPADPGNFGGPGSESPTTTASITWNVPGATPIPPSAAERRGAGCHALPLAHSFAAAGLLALLAAAAAMKRRQP